MKNDNPAKTSKLTSAIVDYIMDLPLFDALKGHELNTVARAMNMFDVPKGEIIFKEGEKGDCICFVVQGSIDIIKESGAGSGVLIASLSKGRSIGEMSVIDNATRSATARAGQTTTFLTLSKQSFDGILQQHPEIGIKILKGIALMLSQNLRKTSSRLADYMLPMT